MSELEAIVQSLSMLISNAELSSAQVNTYLLQVNQLLSLSNRTMQGSAQPGYQDLLSQFLVSKKKLEYAEKCLIEITTVGNDWLKARWANTQSSQTNGTSVNTTLEYGGTNTENNYLKPIRTLPRDLPATQFCFSKTSTGMEVYDSPLEVDKYLYSKQGSAYESFKGTCGLCSCANILRLSGVNIGEREIIDYAANIQGDRFASKLCTVDPFNPAASGGTTPKQRQQILDYFGISSSIWNVKIDFDGRTSLDTINDMANWISEGRGVIIDVDAGMFYNSPRNYGKGHAVTITSVEKNKYGDITAFYILDSNQGTVKCSTWEIREMLRSFVGINVTSQIIR